MDQATAAAPARAPRCFICSVPVRAVHAGKGKASMVKLHPDTLQDMHVIPACMHDSLMAINLFSKRECDTSIATCHACCIAVQQYFSPSERVKALNTAASLKAVMKQVGWVELRLARFAEGDSTWLQKFDWRDTLEIEVFKFKHCPKGDLSDKPENRLNRSSRGREREEEEKKDGDKRPQHEADSSKKRRTSQNHVQTEEHTHASVNKEGKKRARESDSGAVEDDDEIPNSLAQRYNNLLQRACEPIRERLQCHIQQSKIQERVRKEACESSNTSTDAMSSDSNSESESSSISTITVSDSDSTSSSDSDLSTSSSSSDSEDSDADIPLRALPPAFNQAELDRALAGNNTSPSHPHLVDEPRPQRPQQQTNKCRRRNSSSSHPQSQQQQQHQQQHQTKRIRRRRSPPFDEAAFVRQVERDRLRQGSVFKPSSYARRTASSGPAIVRRSLRDTEARNFSHYLREKRAREEALAAAEGSSSAFLASAEIPQRKRRRILESTCSESEPNEERLPSVADPSSVGRTAILPIATSVKPTSTSSVVTSCQRSSALMSGSSSTTTSSRRSTPPSSSYTSSQVPHKRKSYVVVEIPARRRSAASANLIAHRLDRPVPTRTSEDAAVSIAAVHTDKANAASSHAGIADKPASKQPFASDHLHKRRRTNSLSTIPRTELTITAIVDIEAAVNPLQPEPATSVQAENIQVEEMGNNRCHISPIAEGQILRTSLTSTSGSSSSASAVSGASILEAEPAFMKKPTAVDEFVATESASDTRWYATNESTSLERGANSASSSSEELLEIIKNQAIKGIRERIKSNGIVYPTLAEVEAEKKAKAEKKKRQKAAYQRERRAKIAASKIARRDSEALTQQPSGVSANAAPSVSTTLLTSTVMVASAFSIDAVPARHANAVHSAHVKVDEEEVDELASEAGDDVAESGMMALDNPVETVPPSLPPRPVIDGYHPALDIPCPVLKIKDQDDGIVISSDEDVTANETAEAASLKALKARQKKEKKEKKKRAKLFIKAEESEIYGLVDKLANEDEDDDTDLDTVELVAQFAAEYAAKHGHS